MKTIKIKITGISPLMMNKFPMEPIEGLSKKTPDEQAEIACYRDTAGQLFIPGICMQSALVNAAKYSKGKGRASLSLTAAAALHVIEDQMLLGVKSFVIDSRPVVIAATKGRIVRHRPRLDQWSTSFQIEFDDLILSEQQIRRIVDDAGRLVGILEWRPACRGPFGKFMVTNWEN